MRDSMLCRASFVTLAEIDEKMLDRAEPRPSTIIFQRATLRSHNREEWNAVSGVRFVTASYPPPPIHMEQNNFLFAPVCGAARNNVCPAFH